MTTYPGSFDEHHPPNQALLDGCVHCGFCLPTCPTYLVTGEEMEPPRGRIYLMAMAARGEIPLDQAFGGHIDTCLGCLACVTACPSGVQYDKLIEATRPQVERNIGRSRFDALFRALVFNVFPYPSRLRLVALLGALYYRFGLRALMHRSRLIRLLPARVRALEGLMPEVAVRAVFSRTLTHTLPERTRRLTVGVLPGCAQRVFFGDVNKATVRVLAAEGCEVLMPRDIRCCGALSVHAGREVDGLRHARRAIELFEQHSVDVIVTNVAGCGSTMKDYAHLLRDDPDYGQRAQAFSAKVRDVSELLAELSPVAPRHPIHVKVAYHDACHLSNAQRIRTQPRQVLETIPGLELVSVAEPDVCCGSAGIYNLTQPGTADELGRRKSQRLTDAMPDIVVTANAGCLLQIRRYLDKRIPVMHPMQLLDASIRGMATSEEGTP